MSEIPTLKRLERRDNDMLLSWDDGTEHTITYNDLRYYCPCAKCGPLRNEDETALSLRRQVESQKKVRRVNNSLHVCSERLPSCQA